MRIGLSAPTGLLLDTARTEEDALWLAMYGSGAAFLEEMRSLGVTSVEVRDARSVADPADVGRAIDAVTREGLAVTVHLWLPTHTVDLPATFEIVAAALAGTAHDAPVPCAVHGHDRLAFDSPEDAADATISDLRALCEALEGGPLRPAFELCRVKPGGPIGTSFDELVSIAAGVDHALLGFCWDMGHGLDNHLRQRHPLVGRLDFLGRVAHTHIHDLDARGKTHGPLSSHSSEVAQMVKALRGSGYQGVYNLELEPTRWSDAAAACRRFVADSVESLATLLG